MLLSWKCYRELYTESECDQDKEYDVENGATDKRLLMKALTFNGDGLSSHLHVSDNASWT